MKTLFVTYPDASHFLAALVSRSPAPTWLRPPAQAVIGRAFTPTAFCTAVAERWRRPRFRACGEDASAWLKLMDIVDMYDHYTVGDTAAHVPIPATSSKMHSSGLNLPPSDCFVFVHGWRMEPWERRRFAETAYKRLWWFGFRDRFVFFSWPTEYVNSSLVLTQPNNFNNSEWQAWSSGVPLKALLLDLKADPNNVRVMVFAHSMGNVAVGEALRLLTDSGNAETVDKYVAMQGAIPAHTYDQNAETVPVVLNPAIPNRYKDFWPLSTIPKTYACYFDGGNAARDYINWFNRVDYALDKWTINQQLKPIASQFYYDTVGQHFMQYSTVLNLPPDQYAVFSQALPAVCWALGDQPGVNGAFSTGLERDLHWLTCSMELPPTTAHNSIQIGLCTLFPLAFLRRMSTTSQNAIPFGCGGLFAQKQS